MVSSILENKILIFNSSRWYADWQDEGHVRLFDFRSSMSAKNLIRNYESLNDILLLRDRLQEVKESSSILEIGCATGELYRYLNFKFPSVEYYGLDISSPAIDRAV